MTRMTRTIAQVVRPCLRRVGNHTIVPSSVYALSPSNVSTSVQRRTPSRAATTSAAAATSSVQIPVEYAPATKPPSARPIETRKTQLIRTYTSTLRTTPMILFFQHNNLTAVEWAAVRREVTKALAAVPVPENGAAAGLQDIQSQIKLSVLRTNMFDVALKIVEFHDPEAASNLPSTPRTTKGPLVHDLSEAAYKSIKETPIPADSAYAQIEPLMVGPLAALFVPAVSPAHLAASLGVLSPVPGKFPAPKKKKNPGYHEPICQSALSKLLLVGGRIEGRVFDQDGVNWVGGIESGMDGLRAQLVHVLQSAGLGITTTLEGGSKSLWLTLEGRKTQLEDEGKPEKTDG